MTERFGYNNYYKYVVDNEENRDLSVSEAAKILNDLYKENIALKNENAHYKLQLMALDDIISNNCSIKGVKR